PVVLLVSVLVLVRDGSSHQLRTPESPVAPVAPVEPMPSALYMVTRWVLLSMTSTTTFTCSEPMPLPPRRPLPRVVVVAPEVHSPRSGWPVRLVVVPVVPVVPVAPGVPVRVRSLPVLVPGLVRLSSPV